MTMGLGVFLLIFSVSMLLFIGVYALSILLSAVFFLMGINALNPETSEFCVHCGSRLWSFQQSAHSIFTGSKTVSPQCSQTRIFPMNSLSDRYIVS